MIPDAVATQHRIDSSAVVVANSTTYTASVYGKADGYGFLVLRLRDAVSTADAIFNLSTGAVGAITTSSWTSATSSIESVGSGWYRCVFTATSNVAGASGGIGLVRINVGNPSSSGDISSWSGNGTDGILIWGAQVEAGTTASTFQDIGTDKMAVVMGVRKLLQGVRQMFVEHGAGALPTFSIEAPGASGQGYRMSSGGSVLVQPVVSGFNDSAPRVITALGDISGDSAILRVNGSQSAAITTDQGTGNFGNYALFFGRRGGTSLPFNGLDFGGVCIGKTLTATQLANVEKWVAIRTGVSL
jgi:hypothetical protein